MYNQFKKEIFNNLDNKEFKSLSLKLYRHQYQANKLYQQFAKSLNKTPIRVKKLSDIPFLPIEFFKSHQIVSTDRPIEKTFYSSGTTTQVTSRHHVCDLELYKKSFTLNFESRYPNYENHAIIALLPSYIERGNSSLTYMFDELIKKSNHAKSGFYLTINENLMDFLTKDPSPKILVGVTFALLDLAKKQPRLKNCKVIETGGMKGRGKELIREELHQILCESFNIKDIHSEYGMTELLSQAYFSNGCFTPAPWMRVFARQITDPLNVQKSGKGALNVIDLANINSCCFIATDDLGTVFPDHTFLVNGRLDHSQVRGCNLLI